MTTVIICLYLWQNAGLKHGKMLVLYIVSYFHYIRFQVDHVWTIRRPSFANLKEKRRGNLAQRVTTIGAICVIASSSYFSKYSL